VCAAAFSGIINFVRCKRTYDRQTNLVAEKPEGEIATPSSNAPIRISKSRRIGAFGINRTEKFLLVRRTSPKHSFSALLALPHCPYQYAALLALR
jgi:hypothetical protein